VKSKNHKPLTELERVHVRDIKRLPCSLADNDDHYSGHTYVDGTQAHHITQGNHFTTVALCWGCHQGPLGWHGTRVLWKIKKMDEEAALNVTLSRLAEMRARP